MGTGIIGSSNTVDAAPRVRQNLVGQSEMIEIVRSGASAYQAKVGIFDFDGTLSVIRSGWMEIMAPICVKHLRATNSGESDEELIAIVESFIWRLTGKETIYQMMALVHEIQLRGGAPLEARDYKSEYLEALHKRIRYRLDDLRNGGSPEKYTVPGATSWLERLSKHGFVLYLASGTDDANVKEEAQLLRLTPFFEDRVFGAQDDLRSFSKAALVKRLVSESGFSGQELIVFGDGFVEIEEVKRVGGIAVGVATAEPDCQEVDDWKRTRLIEAGADFIVPNFLSPDELEQCLFTRKVEKGM